MLVPLEISIYYAVTPAKAGIQGRLKKLDSSFRQNDEARASSKARVLDKTRAA